MKKLTISRQEMERFRQMKDDNMDFERTTSDDEQMSEDAIEEITNGPITINKPAIPARISSLQKRREVQLGTSTENLSKEYADIAKFKIFQLAGDDHTGRPVIAFSACRLPVRSLIDHQNLFNLLKDTLELYVESDYTLVYFHYGLNSKNKPSLKWLLQIYRELDRKYKKNLKALYIVHPSNFVKIVYGMFYPFISKKFGKKINNISKLDDLSPHLRLDQLDIPDEVRENDRNIVQKTKSISLSHTKLEYPKTQQFGVPLTQLREKFGLDIPIVVSNTIDFIEQNALDVEGIFRRSPQVNLMNDAVNRYNQGEEYPFTTDNVHLAPGLLKKFLRDLPTPLLTFDLYNEIMETCALSEDEKLAATRKMLTEKLPQCNRDLLTCILRFLTKVVEHSSINLMTSTSLGIVFGPNFLWSNKEAATLTSMSKINLYCKYLIDKSSAIFDTSSEV